MSCQGLLVLLRQVSPEGSPHLRRHLVLDGLQQVGHAGDEWVLLLKHLNCENLSEHREDLGEVGVVLAQDDWVLALDEPDQEVI